MPRKKKADTTAETKPPEAEAKTPPTAQTSAEEVAEKMAKMRSTVRETFGSVAMSMMALPRYRHLPIGDLQSILLEPLIRDRVALARKSADAGPLEDLSGMAIWASVSEEVDTKIREQISAGVFPIRLAPDDWTSGKINWLFDVIAPDASSVGGVIANFKQVAKEGELKLHPVVTRLLDKDTLEKLRAQAKEKMES